MNIKLSDDERDLLLSSPETRELARSLLMDEGALIGTAEQYDLLRNACSDLLQKIGFDRHYVPTKDGVVLERLIDKLLTE